MNFLFRDGDDGQQPLIINMDHVVSIEPLYTPFDRTKIKGSMVHMVNGQTYCMLETIEHFAAKLAERKA